MPKLIINSKERHEARRARRQAKRERNKQLKGMNFTIDTVANYNNLYNAALESSHGVTWKYSVQQYFKKLFSNIAHTREDLLFDKDIRKPLSYFDVTERGKIRHIAAPKFSERVIQKSLAQNVLIPAITPILTSGCGANIKGRGTDYSLFRLKQQLADFYRKYKDEGYILLIDFSNFFGNIDHEAAKNFIKSLPIDEKVQQLVYLQIDREGDVGLGLGSEPNQIIAVALPTPLDRLGERWKGILYSGRYMDDSYFISPDKQILIDFLKEAEKLCESLKITMNPKKTRIVKLSRGFVFLKKRFRYSSTGKIIITPTHNSISRHRRKIKKLFRFVENESMSFEDVYRAYVSMRGTYVRKHGDGVSRFRMNTYKTLQSLDKLFITLVKENHKKGISNDTKRN